MESRSSGAELFLAAREGSGTLVSRVGHGSPMLASVPDALSEIRLSIIEMRRYGAKGAFVEPEDQSDVTGLPIESDAACPGFQTPQDR
ncbi:hypothetical protein ACQP08_15170 [Micromonospora zamorensis]|uniref:hypothetical protein n=1 Tax=Micromonospora zamorensis TaxID=709883 RepID=UPI003D8A67BD